MAILGESNLSGISTGFKNKIINGDFEVWQRGTTFADAVVGAYGADRWVNAGNGGTLVYTVSKNVVVPTAAQSGHKSTASYQIEITTLEAAVAAGEFLAFYQMVEGYNYRHLYGKTCTFSFWVNAVKTGIYCVSIRLGDASYSYVSEFTVNAINTWEKKSVTVTFDQDATVPEWDTGIGIYVGVTLMCGTTYHTSADSWQAGNLLATSNQVNGCDDTPNYFNITQIQLEVGSVATPFEDRSYGEELLLCQRYYESGDLAFTSATTITTGSGYSTRTEFLIEKRATPTIVDTSVEYYYSGDWRIPAVINGKIANTRGWYLSAFTPYSGSFIANEAVIMKGTWTADAEL